MALASEQRQHVTVFAAEFARLIHVVANSRKTLEIFFDVSSRFVLVDAELGGEPKGRNAVDDPEIDRLGATPDLARHVLDLHTEYLRCGHRMDVNAVLERLALFRYDGDLRKQAQFDLRVV